MLFLNDGDQHLHLQLVEPKEADHLHLCSKESTEGSERCICEFLVPPFKSEDANDICLWVWLQPDFYLAWASSGA
jgi:hypothetical protein